MIIDCISDLHGAEPELKGGDILIIAGDLTGSDKMIQYQNFSIWLGSLNYEYIIIIGGNHDNYLEENPGYYFGDNGKYLCDTSAKFSRYELINYRNDTIVRKNLKIWGCPWSLYFPEVNPHCKAFMDKEKNLKIHYDLIPNDIDILVTHCPPFGILDETKYGVNVGSASLREKIEEIKPKLVVCGHIHESYGEFKGADGIHYVNASIMDSDYEPVNKPIRVIL
jgi:Icc-related predicted phosphoesterase